MKHIFAATLVLYSFAAHAQSSEPKTENSYDVEKLKTHMNNIGVNTQRAGGELVAFKRQYFTGLSIQMLGVGLLTAGLITASNTPTYPKTKNNSAPFYYAGGSLLVIGGTINLFSHRHIGTAGRLLKMDY